VVRAAAAEAALGWSPVLVILWLVSSALLLVLNLVRLVRIDLHLDAAPPAPASIQAMAEQIALKLGVRQCPKVGLIPLVISPALVAIGRQRRLLIPLELWSRLDEDQRAVLLAHELAHLRRHDHWIRLLELVVISVYWWFPVAWWIRRSLHDAEEECCDAWVVWALPGLERAYVRTLLDAVDFLAEARPVLPPAATGLGTITVLKRRLGRIMLGVAPRTISRAGTVAVVGLAGIIFPLAIQHTAARGFHRGYQIIDLGPFFPAAINNAGQVVGNPMQPGIHRAHRWDRGRWIDLGGPEGTISFATDINDRGQVTGWFRVRRDAGPQGAEEQGTISPDPVGSGPTYPLGFPGSGWGDAIRDPQHAGTAVYSWPHAFRTGPDRAINPMTDDLGTLGGPESYGLAINDLGQVAGESTLPGRDNGDGVHFSPFRTGANRAIDSRADNLYPPGELMLATHRPMAMNDRGEVVVHLDVRLSHRNHRFPSIRTPPGRAIDPDADDLGTAVGPRVEVRARAINDRGQVVGQAEEMGPPPHRRAFRTAPGRRINLATDELRGLVSAHAINNRGHVLGSASPASPPWNHHALHDGEAVHRLGDLVPAGSRWILQSASDLNDRDQIIGWGVNPRGRSSGFLLEPTPDISPVFWLLAGTVLTGLGQAINRMGIGGE
jgi:probable HAF family extracellular repeat protein